MTFRDTKDLLTGMTYWAGVVLLCAFLGGVAWFLFNGVAALVCVLGVVAVAERIQSYQLRHEMPEEIEPVEEYAAPEGGLRQ